MRRKLTPEQTSDLIADYRAWQSGQVNYEGGSTELAQRYGITRQTLYATLAREKVELGDPVKVAQAVMDPHIEAMAKFALEALIDKLSTQQREINDLKVEVSELRKQLSLRQVA